MSRLRILVVDDHPVVRRGVRALLEAQSGWEVCGEAATGRDAVELVRRLKPDVVVIDIGLPDLNGLDATRQILKENPQPEVLVLTMHEAEEMAHQVLQAGARGYIFKSDADQDLVTAVQSLSEHKRFLTAQVTERVLDSYLRGTKTPPAGQEASLPLVTAREREIIQLIAEGKTNKEVASVLNISTKTVEAHRLNIMRKLHLHSVSDLVRYAIRNGIVQP